jgi:hypothetical protein
VIPLTTSLADAQPAMLPGEQAPPRFEVSPPASSANSWEDVADLSASFGAPLDEWQERILQAAMGERADGKWLAKRVGVTVPRQNGKTQVLIARALAGALLFGEKTIIISAHQQDTARETFMKMMELREQSPALDARIAKVMEALNREFIRFTNGAVIKFKARSQSGGRGFSSDCLLLDEAQILKQSTWVSINSTMSARPNPQVWLLGTCPTPEDDGAVFESVRTAALSGKSRTSAWLEWGAEPGDDPAEERTRWKANPAWFTRINHEVVQGEYETYPPDRFALDRLGIWPGEGSKVTIFPDWAARVGEPEQPAALAVAGDFDREWLSLGSATPASIAPVVMENLGAARVERSRASEFVAEVARISSSLNLPVVLQVKGPAWDLKEPLEDAGADVVEATFEDFIVAGVELADALSSGTTTHSDDPDLNTAAANAEWRASGDRKVLSRKTGDVSMLEACALARWYASSNDYDPMSSVLA